MCLGLHSILYSKLCIELRGKLHSVLCVGVHRKLYNELCGGVCRKLHMIPSKSTLISYFRGQIKQNFPVTDRDILIFGGVQCKPWPRKDIDALVILQDLQWIDDHAPGQFQKLIWEVGETVWYLTDRKVAGDLWVYVPQRKQLWHKGFHLDGYAKDVFYMTEEKFPGCNPRLPEFIFKHNEAILKARGIYPYSDDDPISHRKMQC